MYNTPIPAITQYAITGSQEIDRDKSIWLFDAPNRPTNRKNKILLEIDKVYKIAHVHIQYSEHTIYGF